MWERKSNSTDGTYPLWYVHARHSESMQPLHEIVSSSESRTFHERLIAEICGWLSDTSRARSASSPGGQIATHSSTNEGSPEILILALLEESDRHGYEIRAADRN